MDPEFKFKNLISVRNWTWSNPEPLINPSIGRFERIRSLLGVDVNMLRLLLQPSQSHDPCPGVILRGRYKVDGVIFIADDEWKRAFLGVLLLVLRDAECVCLVSAAYLMDLWKGHCNQKYNREKKYITSCMGSICTSFCMCTLIRCMQDIPVDWKPIIRGA